MYDVTLKIRKPGQIPNEELIHGGAIYADSEDQASKIIKSILGTDNIGGQSRAEEKQVRQRPQNS